MRRFCSTLACATLVLSCGGDEGESMALERAQFDLRATAQGPAAPGRRLVRLSDRRRLAESSAASVDPVDAATQLMDFGEVNFPQYFPSRQRNQVWTTFVYRHYPETGALLGVSDGNVFVAGGPFGSEVRLLGPLSSYVTPVRQRLEVTVGPAGATMSIADAASPMNGVALTVPEGALAQASTLTLAKAHGQFTVDPDLRPIGAIVELDVSGAALLKPVLISLPYDSSQHAPGYAVAAFALLESGQHWYPLPVLAYDYEKGLMTVQTTRASKYVVASFASSRDTQTSAFRPSLHGFRIANVPLQTLTTADLSAGFAGFSRWYASAHPGCPSLSRLTSESVQRSIVTEAQAKSRIAMLAATSTRSALPWVDFLAVVSRELASGRPPLVAHLPITTGPQAGLESAASVIWEYRLDASDAYGKLFVYQPNRGPDEVLALALAEYMPPARTYLLPWAELFDDADLHALFDRYKTSLGCVAPTVALSASPNSAIAGQTTTLRWTTTNALGCTASGDWTGAKNAAGGSESVAVGPAVGARNYILSCSGVEAFSSSSQVAVAVVPAPACASIGGRWTETARVDFTCDSGDAFSETQTGSGTIVQTGCTISYSVAGIARTGRVDGNRVTLSGPAALADPGATLTRNVFSAEGTISPDARRIDATGTGEVAGSADGISDRCDLRSRSVLTR